jgi:mono/diheme cytochrome c family protein
MNCFCYTTSRAESDVVDAELFGRLQFTEVSFFSHLTKMSVSGEARAGQLGGRRSGAPPAGIGGAKLLGSISFRGIAMKRCARLLLLLLVSAPLARAQAPGGAPALDDNQLLGMRLFNQSCRVCHVKPQMTSPQYAPALSKDSLGGQEGALRAFITNGSPRMPGFKNHFRPAEIDAIVAYIKTLQ